MSDNNFSWDDHAEQVTALRQTIDKWRDRRGALMPVLQEAQNLFGYLPMPILELISKELSVSMAEIHGVATFYAQFTFIPKGKYNISVCMGTACYVKGGETILDGFRDKLGIDKGETTPDGLFSIVETRCVGECSLAPVVTVNDEIHPHFTVEQIDPLLETLRAEGGTA